MANYFGGTCSEFRIRFKYAQAFPKTVRTTELHLNSRNNDCNLQ